MKIALLNLPFDNNFGGNLQRYALMKVINDMGHEIEHINLRFDFQDQPFYLYPIIVAKFLIKKMIGRKTIPLVWTLTPKTHYQNLNKIVDLFYDKYIKHSHIITNIEELKEIPKYEAYLVGSDQVWRKNIAGKYLSTMFFNFLDDDNAANIFGYSVSLGTDTSELTQTEIIELGRLYNRFKAVSVREDSALKLFKDYGWINPSAIKTLDPTLLLSSEDYRTLIKQTATDPSSGNLFCYILDETEEKKSKIDEIANNFNLRPFTLSIHDRKSNVSIEQWLRAFDDSEYVITDSYHGFVFSLIFNKPVYVFKNKKRGNSRFDSLMKLLPGEIEKGVFDWHIINGILNKEKAISINYLKNIL